ncbi:MAG: ribonuclease P protein component [Actinomycetota bacterium]
MIGRVSGRSAHQAIRRRGRHLRSGLLSCTMLLDPTLAGPHVGYALGRAFGPAVARNRLRRQLREIVKTHEAALAPGFYVFGASPKARQASFGELEVAMRGLVTKCAEGATR